MTINRILQSIITRLFKDDVTISELEDMHSKGWIDLQVMIANERRW